MHCTSMRNVLQVCDHKIAADRNYFACVIPISVSCYTGPGFQCHISRRFDRQGIEQEQYSIKLFEEIFKTLTE